MTSIIQLHNARVVMIIVVIVVLVEKFILMLEIGIFKTFFAVYCLKLI